MTDCRNAASVRMLTTLAAFTTPMVSRLCSEIAATQCAITWLMVRASSTVPKTVFLEACSGNLVIHPPGRP